MYIKFDDQKQLVSLMDKFGEKGEILAGDNNNGEPSIVKVSKSCVVVETYQDNGWLKVEYYHRDGTYEETYGGRWDGQ